MTVSGWPSSSHFSGGPTALGAQMAKFDYRGASVGQLRDGPITSWTDYFDSAFFRS
jgi:hypothetical protein